MTSLKQSLAGVFSVGLIGTACCLFSALADDAVPHDLGREQQLERNNADTEQSPPPAGVPHGQLPAAISKQRQAGASSTGGVSSKFNPAGTIGSAPSSHKVEQSMPSRALAGLTAMLRRDKKDPARSATPSEPKSARAPRAALPSATRVASTGTATQPVSASRTTQPSESSLSFVNQLARTSDLVSQTTDASEDISSSRASAMPPRMARSARPERANADDQSPSVSTPTMAPSPLPDPPKSLMPSANAIASANTRQAVANDHDTATAVVTPAVGIASVSNDSESVRARMVHANSKNSAGAVAAVRAPSRVKTHRMPTQRYDYQLAQQCTSILLVGVVDGDRVRAMEILADMQHWHRCPTAPQALRHIALGDYVTWLRLQAVELLASALETESAHLAADTLRLSAVYDSDPTIRQTAQRALLRVNALDTTGAAARAKTPGRRP